MEGYEPVSNTAFGSIASQDSQRRADARRRARPDDYVVLNDAVLSRFPAVLHQVSGLAGLPTSEGRTVLGSWCPLPS